MSLKKILDQENAEFTDHINRYSMTFKNQKYESEFTLYKFEKKNFLIMIGLSIFFTMLIFGLRFIETPLNNFDDLNKYIPYQIYIVVASLWNAALIIEAIIFCIPKLLILKGFFFNSLPMIALNYLSSYYCVKLASPVPLLTSTMVIYIILVVLICFIYVANWICGGLQILCILGLYLYQILCYNWNWFPIKPLTIGLSISTAMSVILAIYYFEYFQRKAIFMKLQAEEQRQNIKQIIDNFPDPIIISNKGVIEYKNKASIEIKNQLDSSSSSEQSIVIHTTIEDPIILGDTKTEKINDYQNEEEYLKSLELIKHNEKNLNFKEVLNQNIPVNSEHFEMKFNSTMVKYFEITSLNLCFEGETKMLYLLKNLTNFHKIKELKARETFLRVYFASLTHDFRTPLGIIMGNAEMLMLMIHDEELLKNLRIIHNSGSILSLLVQDILDYSQIKSKTLRIAACEFITQKEFGIIIELFHRKFLDKGLNLDLTINKSVPEILFNDSNRIKQVLMNLISNAFKFTVRGGVTVYVDAELNAELINVRVEDTGVGIKEEDQCKLFKEFGKLQSNQDLNPTGIGLGLHICKNIVKHLGGNIGFKSTYNVGTTFFFSFTNTRKCNSKNLDCLNVNESKLIDEEEISSSRIHPDANDSSIKIQKLNDSATQKNLSLLKERKFCNCPSLLIVDDDFGIRNIMASFCKRLSIKYEEAENGQKAIDKVTNKLNSDCCKYYKLIFTDYYMPFLNGIQSSVTIKSTLKQYPDCSTKIILVSGLTSDDNNIINSLEENPFISIEAKPLSFQRFQELVHSFLM